jgi:hypothetical protein
MCFFVRVVILRSPANNRTNLRHIEVFQFPVDGIHHQLLRQRCDERGGTLSQLCPKFHNTIDGDSIRQNGLGIDRRVRLVVHGPPYPGRIEILQSQTDRIDYSVALPATCFGAVLLKPRAHCLRWLARLLR